MSGALTELSAKGVQDSYLTGASADVTFFKCIFRKHTNFAREAVEIQPRSGDGWGKEVIYEIARNGDLVTKMWVVMDLPALTSNNAWANPAGYAAIEYAEVSIGGQRFDRQYGEYMYAWNELTEAQDKSNAIMVGNVGGAQGGGHSSNNDGATAASKWAEQVVWAKKKNRLYVPLDFWFNRHMCMALPLIALQFHQVHIKVKFRDAAAMTRAESNNAMSKGATPGELSTHLLVDYIYLDSAERRLFAGAAEHEYLIETTQHSGTSSVSAGGANHSEKLNFNHPVKQLIWMVRPTAHSNHNNHLDFRGTDALGGAKCATDGANATLQKEQMLLGDWDEGFSEANLKFNGHDRFKQQANTYFRVVQANQHMANVPKAKVYSWSAALDPMSWLPSGSVNMSRIDTCQLNLTSQQSNHHPFTNDGQIAAATSSAVSGFSASDLLVYARSYNVCKIVSGMAGIKYAN